MDSESKIKSARDILSKKKEQMNVAKILEFIKKCEQISESYDALHKTYIDESTAWRDVCTSLLVCISKTIPFDESIFKELLDDIENIKLDVVSSQAEGRQVEVLEKIKNIKNIVEKFSEERRELTSQACSKEESNNWSKYWPESEGPGSAHARSTPITPFPHNDEFASSNLALSFSPLRGDVSGPETIKAGPPTNIAVRSSDTI